MFRFVEQNTKGFIRFIRYVLTPLAIMTGLASRTRWACRALLASNELDRLSKTGLTMSWMSHHRRYGVYIYK